MHVQYKILKNQFKISPQLLVIHIDQTDIGDENVDINIIKFIPLKDNY